jgi:hypothetical protein
VEEREYRLEQASLRAIIDSRQSGEEKQDQGRREEHGDDGHSVDKIQTCEHRPCWGSGGNWASSRYAG